MQQVGVWASVIDRAGVGSRPPPAGELATVIDR